jgi:WD40 repeat protein
MENFETIKDNLLVSSRRFKLQLWDATTYALLGTLGENGEYKHSIECAAMSQDNCMLASATHQEIIGWDLKTKTISVNISCRRIINVCFSKEGTELIGGTGENIYVWNLATGEILREASFPERTPPDNYKLFFCLSPDNSVLIAAGGSNCNFEGVIKVIDYHSCEPQATHAFGDSAIMGAAVSPTNSDEIALAFDAELVIVQLVEGIVSVKCRYSQRTQLIPVPVYSADGSKLYSSTRVGTVFAIDTITGLRSEIAESPGYLSEICLSPDDTTLVAMDYGVIRIIDIASGALIKSVITEVRGGVCWSNRKPQVILL